MSIATLADEHQLDPDVTPVLTAAFDQAWAKVIASGKPLSDEDAARTALALRIIQQAQAGERDVGRLVDDALAHLAAPRG